MKQILMCTVLLYIYHCLATQLECRCVPRSFSVLLSKTVPGNATLNHAQQDESLSHWKLRLSHLYCGQLPGNPRQEMQGW